MLKAWRVGTLKTLARSLVCFLQVGIPRENKFFGRKLSKQVTYGNVVIDGMEPNKTGKEGRREVVEKEKNRIISVIGSIQSPDSRLPKQHQAQRTTNTHYCSLFTIVIIVTISRLKMNQSPSIASTLSIVVLTCVLTSILTFTSAQEVVHLDDSNFKDMTAGKIVFIKFYAPW